MILVIDEIDAFTKSKMCQAQFNSFLKEILGPMFLPKKKGSVTVVGIANSIELFDGEY